VTPVGYAVLQRRKRLRRLRAVERSPDEAWALRDRVHTPTSSADARDRCAHLRRIAPRGDEALGVLAVADADQPKRDDAAFVTVVTDGRIAVRADATQGAVRCRLQRGGERWSMGARSPSNDA
jgi:hypothetical protein